MNRAAHILWPCTLQGLQRTYQVSWREQSVYQEYKRHRIQQNLKFLRHSKEVLPIIIDFDYHNLFLWVWGCLSISMSLKHQERVEFKLNLILLAWAWWDCMAQEPAHKSVTLPLCNAFFPHTLLWSIAHYFYGENQQKPNKSMSPDI